MTRDLVLARVGARSLHPTWTDPAWSDPDAPRDWDLVLLPYQPVPPPPPGCTLADVVPGPKWSGLRTHLAAWDSWRDYDRIWLPDDDLLVDAAGITAMFTAARSLDLQLFAPALHDASYFSHFSTMRNHSFGARRTGFVEIMAPGLTAAALAELLPTLDLTETGWGWGLDSLWPHLLGHERVGVLDSTPVRHTRPVGQLRDPELGRRVLAESDHIMEHYGCRQVHTTFAAYDADLTPLDHSPAAFFADLVAGWQHLIDDDPRILGWLVDYQRDLLDPAAYPVEGTPGGGPLRQPG